MTLSQDNLVQQIAGQLRSFKPAPNIGMSEAEQAVQMAKEMVKQVHVVCGLDHLQVQLERTRENFRMAEGQLLSFMMRIVRKSSRKRKDGVLYLRKATTAAIAWHALNDRGKIAIYDHMPNGWRFKIRTSEGWYDEND